MHPVKGVVKKATPYTLIYTRVVDNTKAVTTAKWTLEKIEKGSRLLLEHSGISNYEGETAVAMFTGSDQGWDNCMTELLNFLKYLTKE